MCPVFVLLCFLDFYILGDLRIVNSTIYKKSLPPWINCTHVSSVVQSRAVLQSSGPLLPVSSLELFTSFTQHI